MQPRRFQSFSRELIGYFIVALTFMSAVETKAAPKAESPRRCEAIFKALPRSIEQLVTLEDGSHTFVEADREAKRLLATSPLEQSRAVEFLLANYRRVPKRHLHPMKVKRFGGRRLFDRVLSLVGRRDLAFKKLISEGRSTKQAFAQVFDAQAKVMNTKYDVSDIETVLQILRDDLPLQQAKVGRYALQLLVGGSFVNGKASLIESDVDVSINNPDIKGAARGWEEKIARGLSGRHEFTNLAVELHGEPASFYGKLNHFVFEITASGVRLYVYPPASPSHDGGLTSGTPDVYDWK